MPEIAKIGFFEKVRDDMADDPERRRIH